MDYQPLHHKYRPQSFAELVGQEAIATTLTNAIARSRIAPAYLFTGPRGTGKTSSARILAKSLNCLSSDRPTHKPCGVCEVCLGIVLGSALDVIEIDAASNTGVDNIREIIERSQFVPIQCRYKVYVIDECHMLSQAAFNALLKTLEEPPERVVFVLATTDPQRVLPTIVSRCQRFDYRRIPIESMVSHLKYIASLEKIDITDEAITIVAQIANGGLRDAQSLLDQLSLLSGKITIERVWDLVGAVSEPDLLALLRAIAAKESITLLQQCRHLMDRGREPLVVLQNLASFYLNLLIAKTAPNRPDMVAVTATTWKQLCQEANNWELGEILRGQQHLKDSEVQIKNTTQPRLWLEVTLLGLLSSASLPLTNQHSEDKKQVSPPPQKKADNSKSKFTLEATAAQPPLTPVSVEESAAPEPITPVSEQASAEREIPKEQIWEQVLERLQPPTTQALVRPYCYLISFEGSVAIIGVKPQSILKHVQPKVANIEDAFAKVCRYRVTVRLQVATPNLAEENSNQQPKKEQFPPQPPENLDKTPTTKPKVLPQNEPITSSDRTSSNISERGIVPENNAMLDAAVAISLKDNNGNSQSNYLEDDLKRAAAIFAKALDGEIVNLAETALFSERSEPQALSFDLELSEREAKSSEQTKVTGRPDPNDSVKEEDLPF